MVEQIVIGMIGMAAWRHGGIGLNSLGRGMMVQQAAVIDRLAGQSPAILAVWYIRTIRVVGVLFPCPLLARAGHQVRLPLFLSSETSRRDQPSCHFLFSPRDQPSRPLFSRLGLLGASAHHFCLGLRPLSNEHSSFSLPFGNLAFMP